MREMVGQIFFRHGQGFYCRDSYVWLNFDDSIDERKSHEISYVKVDQAGKRRDSFSVRLHPGLHRVHERQPAWSAFIKTPH